MNDVNNLFSKEGNWLTTVHNGCFLSVKYLGSNNGNEYEGP